MLVLGSILLGIVVSAGAATAQTRRRRLGPEAALARALDEVLSDSLDDLRAERDPRKAVIRAYARMEKTFAAYGVPREEHETPLEYVERVLDRLRVSSYAVRRLMQLFERAKFSPHEIDAAMKDDAIEALAGLRAELELRAGRLRRVKRMIQTPGSALESSTGRSTSAVRAAVLRRLRAAAPLRCSTIALFVLALAQPGRFALEFDVYILVVGTWPCSKSCWLRGRRSRAPGDSALAEALDREPPGPLRPPELERLERELTLGGSTAFDLHFRLRPILREIADERLAAAAGCGSRPAAPRSRRLSARSSGSSFARIASRPPAASRPGSLRAAAERVVERLEAL